VYSKTSDFMFCQLWGKTCREVKLNQNLLQMQCKYSVPSQNSFSFWSFSPSEVGISIIVFYSDFGLVVFGKYVNIWYELLTVHQSSSDKQQHPSSVVEVLTFEESLCHTVLVFERRRKFIQIRGAKRRFHYSDHYDYIWNVYFVKQFSHM
jgi:hypothetical protein